MNTTDRDSLSAGDCGDGDDVEDPLFTSRGWVLVWSAWGLVVGAIILWLDRDPTKAALWLALGIAIPTCVVRLFGRFTSPAYHWYRRFASNPEQRHRMIELLIDEKTDSEEYKRLSDNETYRELTILPPMFGLFYGVLLGGICGALCGLAPTLNITASEGAMYGTVVGIIGASFITAGVFALIILFDKTLPFTPRIVWCALMLVSPLLVVPVVCHCVTWMVTRRSAIAA